MARQELRDSIGRKLGTIEDLPNEQIGYDAIGRKKGRYDKKWNKTYDDIGRLVGEGNFLSSLITRP